MDDSDTTIATTTFNPTDDICSQLMQRYSTSAAPQHRHLLATAAAIKSLILQQSPSLTLSPLSYFAAAMSALSDNHDADSSAALATLLSIVLPLVPQRSVSFDKAGEAVEVLVRVLGGNAANSTSTAKCVVKCLGVLLGFCDLNDWNSVQLPFETLLKWSLDKRPKVRRCALEYLENAFKSLKSGSVAKKMSKLIVSLLESQKTKALKLGESRNVAGSRKGKQPKAEHSDIVHVLSVVRVALPYLSDEVSVEIVVKLVELLDAPLSAFGRVVLNAVEAFLNKVEVEAITEVAEDIVSALSSYITLRTNPADSLVLGSNLLKIALDKISAGDIGKWNRCFAQGVNAMAGLLMCEDEVASKSSTVLKNLIDHQISIVESEPAGEILEDDPKSYAIVSLCSIILKLLDSVAGIPNEHVLAVVSVLFLKLGRKSTFYMRNIVLKLAEIVVVADGKESDTCPLQKCIGCAVVAMGAENILGLIPVSFDVENLTCSNLWVVPILKEYTLGASLRSYMELIAPVAESIQKATRKVKKSVTGRDLQAHAHGLWGLLTAFCRYPTDIKESFQSLVKLILGRLKKDASMHEDIAAALQELIRQNKRQPECNSATTDPQKHSSGFLLEDQLLEKRRLFCYSKKDANKNLKVLSSHSNELLQALITAYLDSSPQRRSSVKKAISSLASISKPSDTNAVFVSYLERFPLVKAVTESGDLPNTSLDNTSDSISAESQWTLTLDLASSFLKGADENLVGLIFGLIKHALQAEENIGVAEAYLTLSCILEEHPWFCSSKMDELIALLSGLKSPADVASFSNRLCCFRILLINALKSSTDVENNTPFLLLNNILVALKDSKEDARKVAYDVLLQLSSCLEDPSSADLDGPYYRLISMVMGYFSGASPQISSAAVSALSVLVFKEPELCVKFPDVIPSVASLLQTKAIEVIKAVLGFIKVLVSCLEAKELQNFVSILMDGLLPWSSVSRHHFRSKVTVILEILIRKCGFPALMSVTPERYHPFIKKVSLNRQGKTSSKEGDSANVNEHDSDASIMGSNKRLRNETNDNDSGSKLHTHKRQKQNQVFDRPVRNGNNRGSDRPIRNGSNRGFDRSTRTASNSSGFGKKDSHFKQRKGGVGHDTEKQKMNRGKWGKASAGPGKSGGKFNQKARRG